MIYINIKSFFIIFMITSLQNISSVQYLLEILYTVNTVNGVVYEELEIVSFIMVII